MKISQGHGLRQSSLFNTAAISLGLKIIAALLGLVGNILLARFLGPSSYGIYGITMAAVTVLAIVAANGLPSLLTREVAVYQSQGNWVELKGLIRFSYQWSLAVSGILFLLGVIYAYGFVLGDKFSWLSLLLTIFLIPLTAVNQIRASILRGLHQVIIADIPELFVRPVIFILAVSFLYLKSNEIKLENALSIQLSAIIGSFVIGVVFLHKFNPVRSVAVDAVQKRKKWLQESWIFLGATLVSIFEIQLPLYMSGYLASAKEAGLYSASSQVVSAVALGLVAVNMPLQPKLATAWGSGDRINAQRLVSDTARMGMVIALFATTILLVYAENIMKLYGADFVSAALVLKVLVFGQLLNAVSGPCGVVLAMTGNQNKILFSAIFALIVNFILCVILIPTYGSLGAAIAASIGLFTWNSIQVYQSWHRTKLLTFIK